MSLVAFFNFKNRMTNNCYRKQFLFRENSPFNFPRFRLANFPQIDRYVIFFFARLLARLLARRLPPNKIVINTRATLYLNT